MEQLLEGLPGGTVLVRRKSSSYMRRSLAEPSRFVYRHYSLLQTRFGQLSQHDSKRSQIQVGANQHTNQLFGKLSDQFSWYPTIIPHQRTRRKNDRVANNFSSEVRFTVNGSRVTVSVGQFYSQDLYVFLGFSVSHYERYRST